ncbi:MAG: DUF3168 domain-containing protein [Gemmatimonadetes bacterium]|nr:DUF3168 domain-containing protein [Gemmatimonadota bacterium]
MSYSSVNELSSAVAVYLQGDDGLTDLVSGIQVLSAPPASSPPYVRFGEKRESSARTFSRDGMQVSMGLEIAVAGDSDQTALEVYNMVKGSIEQGQLLMPTFRVVERSVWLEKTSLDADGVTWRAFARLDAIVQAL